MNNTRIPKFSSVIFVLVTATLCISFVLRISYTKNKEIKAQTNAATKLKLDNNKLRKSSQDVKKELQNTNTKLKVTGKDLQISKNKISDLTKKHTKEIKTLQDNVKTLKEKNISFSRGGSVDRTSSSSGYNSSNIKRKVNTVVTAYSLNGCGKSSSDSAYGITASGKRAVANWTVAVDPSIIPLGSTIYIPAFKSYPNKGIFHAEDTGVSGLFGVDVFVHTDAAANLIGRSVKEVYILK